MNEPDTNDVGTVRRYVLRAVYLFIAVGLLLTIWPDILFPAHNAADPGTVIKALLGGLSLMCLVGVRYPLRMLPILMFELVWKLIWVIAFALRMWLHGGLDAYASETFFACMMGVVIVPLAVPWRHVFDRYVRARSEPWHGARTPRSHHAV